MMESTHKSPLEGYRLHTPAPGGPSLSVPQKRHPGHRDGENSTVNHRPLHRKNDRLPPRFSPSKTAKTQVIPAFFKLFHVEQLAVPRYTPAKTEYSHPQTSILTPPSPHPSPK